MSTRLELDTSEYVPPCRGKTELFFDQRAESSIAKLRRENAAKNICRECNLVEDCLDVALSNNEHGIWGGASEEERRRISRKRRLTTR